MFSNDIPGSKRVRQEDIGRFLFFSFFFLSSRLLALNILIYRRLHSHVTVLALNDDVPVPPELEMRSRLTSILASSQEAWKREANFILAHYGYKKLYLNRGAADKAYYYCSCDKAEKTCFKVKLERAEWKGKKKGKFWKSTSFGERKDACLPVEPSGAALSEMFIPEEIKLQLIQAFDSGLNVKSAFDMSTTVGRDLNLPLTWDQPSVKNFFDRLTRAKDDELLAVLSALGEQGHCVILDVKTLPDGGRVLNRFFFASVTMQALFNIFGKDICTLDSTYGYCFSAP